MYIYLKDKPYKGWSIRIKGNIDFTITEKALKSNKYIKFMNFVI